ncbi:MAG: ACT domain-containing protein [Gemmatimonadales bacterium]
MVTRQQLSVTMGNAPGTLAIMGDALAAKNVNILALMSIEHEGRSLIRMIVDNVAVAKKALQAIGYAYTEEQVLATKLPNRPGTLATIAKRLGDAGVNIDYAYLGAESRSLQQLVVLSVSDPDRAKRLLK